MNVRVVNGWDVDISAYPYMVRMLAKKMYKQRARKPKTG